MEDLKWISSQRRRLGITQQRLAALSGVSQSLIAKVESGRVDAAYSKVRAILEALSAASATQEKTARQIMHSPVHTVSGEETLHSVAKTMRKLSISQLPVSDGKGVVGSISEEAILSNFSDDPKKTANLRVSDAMGEAFPTALGATPLSAVASLLRHHPAVLVMEKGKVSGIITKADLLATI